MDTGYRADPAAFARQMETFAKMRATELRFRHWSRFEVEREAVPANKTRSPGLPAPPYPRGVIDLRRLTGRNLPSTEPRRNQK